MKRISYYLLNAATNLLEFFPRSDEDQMGYSDHENQFIEFSFKNVTYNEVRLIISKIKNKRALDA